MLPSAEALRANRWLRWLGPALHHPKLWHISRRGLALGMALGVFFGLLIPLAQIPLSAAAAVALRANVPAAVASTLVTNPVTFGPIYYAAWRVGSAMLGEPGDTAPPSQVAAAEEEEPVDESWWRTATRRVLGVGKPLLLGLVIIATAIGVATYFLVSAAWKLAVLWKRHRRRR
jgi:hypothetical protein